MKTLLMILFACFSLLAQEKDTTFSRQLYQQIAEKDSIINYLQGVLLKDAFEKNSSVQFSNKKYFFRDEIMKREQLEEVLQLYLKESESFPDSTVGKLR